MVPFLKVGQLRVDHSTLLKRLTDVNQKYDDAAVDNRILKADIETLRAKVSQCFFFFFFLIYISVCMCIYIFIPKVYGRNEKSSKKKKNNIKDLE